MAAQTLKERLDEIYWELSWPRNIKSVTVNVEKGKLVVEIEMEQWFWTRLNVATLEKALEDYYYHVYWIQIFPIKKCALLHLKEKVKKRNNKFFPSKNVLFNQLNSKWIKETKQEEV